MLNPDPVSALVNLFAGEVDAVEFVTPDGMSRIAAQDDVRAIPYSFPNYGYLGFNLRDQKNPERPHPLFGDVHLRRALSMAIDRQALRKNVYDTLAWPGIGPVSRLSATADTMARMLPFDSAGSDRLLDSLGWRDQNGDGVREKNGRPLRFGVMAPASSPARRRYAELLQAQLRPHGVKVDVDVIDFTVFVPRLQGSKFDALIHNSVTEPSPAGIRDQWHSMPVSGRAQNFLLYGNPAVDAAIDSAVVTTDPAGSRALYRRAYQGIIDDAVAVWLYENRNYMAMNRRVQPVMRGSDVWWRYLREWSIPAADRLPRHNQ
jgi:peptide/nickel transport system substrate-binding protein